MTFILKNRVSPRAQRAVSLLVATGLGIALFLPSQYDYNYPPRAQGGTSSILSFVTFDGTYLQKIYLFYTGQTK